MSSQTVTNVTRLIEQLGTLNTKYGSSSKKSWPCKRPSPATVLGPSKTEVDGELLPAIVGLTWGSPELRQKSKGLAENWQGDDHNSDDDNQAGRRVETRLTSFPSDNRTVAATATSDSTGGTSKKQVSQTMPVLAPGIAFVSPPTTPPRDSIVTTKPHSTSGSPSQAKHRPESPAIATLPSPPATPRYEASTVQIETTTVRQLRERLGLDSRYCGSGKQDDPHGSCGCPSRGKADEIDRLLVPLATLKLADPDLEDLLDEVAGKWHCHHHAWGHYKANQVARWVLRFPVHDVPVIAKDTFKSVVGLKKLLGLRGWTCGSYLKKCETNPNPRNGTRCRGQSMPYLKGDTHKTAVEKILESLASLTRTSPGFKAVLVRLAEKWHCESHLGTIYAEDRAREWLALFPGGPTTAASITTANVFANAEVEIRELLRPLSPRCPTIAASTNEQCRNSIAGRNIRHCDNLADEIASLAVTLDNKKLKVLLELLDLVGRCSWHVKPDDVQVATWLSHIRDITRDLPPAAAPDNSASMHALQSLAEFEQSSYSRFTPSGHDESPLHIVHQSDEPKDPESIRQRIASKWREPLTKEEQDVKKGFVYAYTVKENPQFVKIGYTSRTVTTRQIEWQTACDREVVSAYPIYSKDVVLIPYPRRAEALCHAELEHCRVRVECGPCRVQHKEWFEVPVQKAVDVIQTWARRMAKNPYGVV